MVRVCPKGNGNYCGYFESVRVEFGENINVERLKFYTSVLPGLKHVIITGKRTFLYPYSCLLFRKSKASFEPFGT